MRMYLILVVMFAACVSLALPEDEPSAQERVGVRLISGVMSTNAINVRLIRDELEPLLEHDQQARRDLHEAIMVAVQSGLKELLPILIRNEAQASFAQMCHVASSDSDPEVGALIDALRRLYSSYSPGVANPIYFTATGAPERLVRLSATFRGRPAALAAQISD